MNSMLKFIKLFFKRSLRILVNKRVEKVIIYCAIIFAFVLMFSQIGLMSDTIRPYLSDIEVFEGHYINEIDSLIKEGTLTLELVDISKEKDIKVLINGIEVACFENKTIDLNVKDNSIIEIDGSRLKTPIIVKIISKTSNIKDDLIGKQVTVESNIKILTRIKIK